MGEGLTTNVTRMSRLLILAANITMRTGQDHSPLKDYQLAIRHSQRYAEHDQLRTTGTDLPEEQKFVDSLKGYHETRISMFFQRQRSGIRDVDGRLQYNSNIGFLSVIRVEKILALLALVIMKWKVYVLGASC